MNVISKPLQDGKPCIFSAKAQDFHSLAKVIDALSQPRKQIQDGEAP